MSTRCLIAIKHDENYYESIYCHWDGYNNDNGVGPTLRNHYPDRQSAERLIALGDLSSLSPDKPIAYHRDLGDPWARTKPRQSRSETNLIKLARQCDANYLYLFSEDHWRTIKIA